MTPADRVPETLGPYRILEPIGKGGMATVYRAHQPSVDRIVAVKVLPVELCGDPTFVGRFDREAKVLAQLEHPHILPVYDFGRQGTMFYLVLRYLSGGTLREMLVREGPMPIPALLRVASQVGGALAYAHRRGVLHRDVKSSNVLLDADRDAFLGDFGLARPMNVQSDLTTAGHVIGTPAYMAPEQSLGESVDARTDVYSFGVLLYEMATGRIPFQASASATPVMVLARALREPPVPPRSLRPDLPPAIEGAILQAMEKQPGDRYPSIEAMLEALGVGSGERTATVAVPRLAPASRRRTFVLAALSGLVAVAAAAVALRKPLVEEPGPAEPPSPAYDPAGGGATRPPPPEEPVGPGWRVFLSPDDVRVVASAGDRVWAGGSGGLVRWRPSDRSVDWFRTTEGLPSNQVSSLVARADGSVWVATDRGVAHLDAGSTEWTIYGHDQGLDSESVVHLYDDDGVLWALSINGERGLDVFDGERWGAAPVPALPPETLSDLRRIARDRAGRLWIGLSSGGTLRRDGREWQVHRIDGDAGVRDFEVGPRGLLAATDQGVYRYTHQAAAWTRATRGGEGVAANDVHEKDERLWIACEGGVRHGANFVESESEELPAYDVTSVAEDREGGLWFGMAGAGLARFEDGQVTHWALGRPGPAVNDLARVVAGPGGALWVLPVGRAGVYERRPDGTWQAHAAANDALPDPDVGACDGRGATWIAQWGDVRVHDGTTWKPVTVEALRDQGVEAFAFGRDGAIWCGLQSGGIVRLDPAGGPARSFGPESGLPGESIPSMAVAADGTVLALSAGRVFELAGPDWKEVPAPPDEVRRLAVSAQGTVWALAGDRLLSLDAGGWREVPGPGFSFDAIAPAPDGAIWVAGWGHVARLPAGAHGWEALGAWPRELSEDLRDAVVGSDRVLWVATAGGLGRFELGPP